MSSNDPRPANDLSDTHRARQDPPQAGADSATSQEVTRRQYRFQAGQTEPKSKSNREPVGLPAIPGFEVLEELGRGGMGVVYKARQQNLNRLVALKVLRTIDLAGTNELARFRREAEVTARAQHPGIVQVYDVGDFQGQPYFSFEYMEGGSLSQRLRLALPTPQQAAAILLSLADAMDFAHQHGIIHRDLKPANVLIATNGAATKAADRLPAAFDVAPSCFKIGDFGLAKYMTDEAGRTAAGTILGSPSYMAPEQAIGDLPRIGARSDVYSLGAVLYEMLTGRPPFRAATAMETLTQVFKAEPLPPSRLQHKLPRDLETICLKCLQKDPAKRYESAKALAGDLGRYISGKPIRARPVSVWESGWRWCRRNPAIAALAGGLAAVISLALVTLTLLYLRADSQRQLADANAAKAQAAERQAAANLAESLKLMASYLDGLGEHVKAEANLRQAIALRRRLAEEQPEDLDQRIEQAILQNNLANLLADNSRGPEAELAYGEAIALIEGVVQQQPSELKYHRVLAACLNNLGNFQTGQCRYADAETTFNRVLPLQEELVKNTPTIAEYAWELGNSYANMGMMLTSADRAPEALPWLEKGIDQLQRVVDRNNRLTTARQFLSLAYANRARALVKLNRATEAISDWDQAILQNDGGNRPRFRAERAQAVAKSGDTSAAWIELAEVAKGQNLNTTLVYEMARTAALCAAHPDDERATNAVEWLNRIAALDYFRNPGNCRRLHQETDFAILRPRSDFQELLKQWPAKNQSP